MGYVAGIFMRATLNHIVNSLSVVFTVLYWGIKLCVYIGKRTHID
jgi:hypothetical protein